MTAIEQFTFKCVNCGNKIFSAYEYAGKTEPCPHCSTLVQAPTLDENKLAVPEREDEIKCLDIIFSCPNCAKRIKTSPEFAGRNAECPSCLQVISAPMLSPFEHRGGDETSPLESNEYMGASRENKPITSVKSKHVRSIKEDREFASNGKRRRKAKQTHDKRFKPIGKLPQKVSRGNELQENQAADYQNHPNANYNANYNRHLENTGAAVQNSPRNFTQNPQARSAGFEHNNHPMVTDPHLANSEYAQAKRNYPTPKISPYGLEGGYQQSKTRKQYQDGSSLSAVGVLMAIVCALVLAALYFLLKSVIDSPKDNANILGSGTIVYATESTVKNTSKEDDNALPARRVGVSKSFHSPYNRIKANTKRLAEIKQKLEANRKEEIQNETRIAENLTNSKEDIHNAALTNFYEDTDEKKARLATIRSNDIQKKKKKMRTT